MEKNHRYKKLGKKIFQPEKKTWEENHELGKMIGKKTSQSVEEWEKKTDSGENG